MLGALLDGRYRLDAELRRDPDGVVYAGRDERLNRAVAVTVIAPERATDAAYLERCRDRVGRLASITHPHLVAVYDSSLEGETPFIVTPLVEGRSLRQREVESGPLRPDDARRVGAQASSALAALHDRGLVHGGLDPDHILLGDGGELYLTDLARPPAKDVAERIPYLAPELALGQEPDARSDVFALCAVLYEAVVGELPYQGTSAEEQYRSKLSHSPLPPAAQVAGLSADLSDAILLGLSAVAAQRPSDGARLALRLETVQSAGLEATQAMAPTQVMSTPPPPPLQPAVPKPAPDPAGAGGAGGILPWLGLFAVVAVVSGLWFALRNPKLPEPPPVPADQTVVPAVIGQLEKDAQAALRDAGLQFLVTARESSDTVPGGHVIEQDPPAGSPPPANKLVKLIVSTGPRFVGVPQVVGLSEAEAKKLLPKYGFVVSTQTADDPDKPFGEVLAQSPRAGQKVDKGAAVTLFVNQHPDPEEPGDAPADGPVTEPDTPSDTTPAEGGILDQAAEDLKNKAKEKAGEMIDQAAEDLKQGAAEQWDRTKDAARDKVRETREGIVEGVKDKLKGDQGGQDGGQ